MMECVVPAENSISWMLPRLVGTANAMDLLLSARVVLAEEALRLGLVNRVMAPEDLLPVTLEYTKVLADTVKRMPRLASRPYPFRLFM